MDGRFHSLFVRHGKPYRPPMPEPEMAMDPNKDHAASLRRDITADQRGPHDRPETEALARRDARQARGETLLGESMDPKRRAQIFWQMIVQAGRAPGGANARRM